MVNGTASSNRQAIDAATSPGRAVLDYVTLASMTDGYMVADMKDLVGGALQQAVIRAAKSGEQEVCIFTSSCITRLG